MSRHISPHLAISRHISQVGSFCEGMIGLQSLYTDVVGTGFFMGPGIVTTVPAAPIKLYG